MPEVSTVDMRCAGAAQRRKAEARLRRIEELRDAALLDRARRTQREIAEIVDRRQPRVHRMLRAMRDRDPLEATPEEIILRGVLGQISRKDMLALVKAYPYTFTQRAPDGMDGSILCTWSDVRVATGAGYFTRDEFDDIYEHVQERRP